MKKLKQESAQLKQKRKDMRNKLANDEMTEKLHFMFDKMDKYKMEQEKMKRKNCLDKTERYGLAVMVVMARGHTLRIKVLVCLKKECWFIQTFRSSGLQVALLVLMRVLISVIG